MNIRKFTFILSATTILISYNLQVYAEGFAYIDTEKIMSNYSKAQELSVDLKTKTTDLQKIALNAIKNVKLAKISQRKLLEDKYKKEFKEKQTLYKLQYLSELQKVESDIQDAVITVAKSKNVSLILNKNSVMYGGIDLTYDVLAVLKSKK